MKWSLWSSLLLGAGLVLLSVPSQAATVRLPKAGDPAFSVDVPTGWTYDYDEYGNLQFTASDRSTALQLSMVTGPNLANAPLSDFAAVIFKTAGAPPFSKSEASTISGHEAQAFYGNLPINGQILPMKVVIAKLDDSHFACLASLTHSGATPEQIAALNALIGLVQLSNPK